ILRGAGPDGLPTLAIADRMVERTPGVTRLIDRLAAKGWVTRTRATDDRRRVDCCISEDGLALLASLDEMIDGFDVEMLGMLREDEQLQLIGLLDRVRAGLATG
ncbi:MAG: MarR family transcriptional regulator, partial [Acidobacteriota bacterium]